VQELNGVGMAQLMRRHASPDAGLEREVVQLDPSRAG
jgi:hypothetical protein